MFYNYTWDPNPRHKYSVFGKHYTPARVPITAYVEGAPSRSTPSAPLTRPAYTRQAR